MDIHRDYAFEEYFKTTEIYKRELNIRKGDILAFSSNFGYFNIVSNESWKIWQASKVQAVPEGFFVVPKELSIDDARKHAETMFNKVEQMVRHEHRDLNETEFEAFKNRRLEARTLNIQNDWNAMIEAQEHIIRSS